MTAPGYLFVTGAFWDNDKRDRYSKALPPIYAKYGGFYIAYGGGAQVEVVEGILAPRGNLIAKFASPAAVEAFWWSSEYRAAVQHRLGGGAFTVLRLEGRAGDAPGRLPVGTAFLQTLAKARDAGHLAAVTRDIETLATRTGGQVLASAAPNTVMALEGAFFDYAVHIMTWPSLSAARSFVVDPAYARLAAERCAGGDVVVMVRPGVDNPPF